MILIDVEQGTDEWHDLRRGIPTASAFKRIITPAKGELSKSSTEYAAELVAERLGHKTERFVTDEMQHGIDTEAEARAWFELEMDMDVSTIGIALSDNRRMSCSPDGLIWKDGVLLAGLELKCPAAHTHIMWAEGGVLPDTHKAQVHGSLFITGAPRWYFMSYVRGLKPFLIEVTPDHFTAALGTALLAFCDQVDDLHKHYI